MYSSDKEYFADLAAAFKTELILMNYSIFTYGPTMLVSQVFVRTSMLEFISAEATSTHVVSGSYEGIAKKIFQGLDYETFYLEYESERPGDFELLRYLPVGKNVVLGVVLTKIPELENVDGLVGKVNAAADVIARGQCKKREEVIQQSLSVSPQCGFASMSQGGGVGVTEERMWEKLVQVRDLARKIWKDAVYSSYNSECTTILIADIRSSDSKHLRRGSF